jgi:PIF1-like helicase/Helix-turn-helix domain/HRDC domain/Helicase
MFQLAIQLVNQSNRNIFLTGKAGTGKTTFLKYIREHCHKQMAVVAPTGVAAINAGGVTIHSFFQLPLAPFIPEARGTGFQNGGQEISNKHSLISRLRFNGDKKKVLQQLELLVIDEISMVRCDTLDAIDTVLRHVRQRPNERFGGAQLLFIGDMLQLPPVIKEQEWSLLAEYYNGPYFFDSKVLSEEPPVYIEFNKIYRQRDEQFINILNQVRNNELNEEGVSILDSRFLPTFRRRKQDGYIILTTHNSKAAEINGNELTRLDTKLFSYEAEVLDEFSDRAYPADQVLQLKEGAQVMFIRNDAAEKGKRFFNGKIGVISRLEKDKIFVQCEGDSSEIEVQKEKWENIRYTLNKESRQLVSDVLGSFTQYPLRLAWAITIHKSQGLTFEKAIIDAGAAFAPGQVYVALSRCTSLEGMVLQSKVRSNSLFSDHRIVQFSQRSASSNQLQQELAIAKRNYALHTLVHTFDFSNAIAQAKELIEYLWEHSSSFNPEALGWVESLVQKMEADQETARKFQTQLHSLFQQEENTDTNQLLQQRIKAAAVYFISAIHSTVQLLQQSPAITDSRLHAKEYNDGLREIFAQLSLQQFLLEPLPDSFEIEAFQRHKTAFKLPSFSVNAYAGAAVAKTNSPRPVLQQQLRKVRDTICARKDIPLYLVAGTATIEEMVLYLPQSLAELKKISGFGEAKVSQYGQQFLDVILAYTEEHGLSSLMHEKTPKKEKKERVGDKKQKIDTKAASYQLFKEGKSIAEIAKERSFTVQTVEGHLAYFVEQGIIKISELISPDRLLIIEPAMKNFKGGSITEIKEQVGADISFGEIKLALAWQAFKKTSSAD